MRGDIHKAFCTGRADGPQAAAGGCGFVPVASPGAAGEPAHSRHQDLQSLGQASVLLITGVVKTVPGRRAVSSDPCSETSRMSAWDKGWALGSARPLRKVTKDSTEGAPVGRREEEGRESEPAKHSEHSSEQGPGRRSSWGSACSPRSRPQEHPTAALGFLQAVARPRAQEAGLDFDSLGEAGDGGWCKVNWDPEWLLVRPGWGAGVPVPLVAEKAPCLESRKQVWSRTSYEIVLTTPWGSGRDQKGAVGHSRNSEESKVWMARRPNTGSSDKDESWVLSTCLLTGTKTETGISRRFFPGTAHQGWTRENLHPSPDGVALNLPAPCTAPQCETVPRLWKTEARFQKPLSGLSRPWSDAAYSTERWSSTQPCVRMIWTFSFLRSICLTETAKAGTQARGVGKGKDGFWAGNRTQAWSQDPGDQDPSQR